MLCCRWHDGALSVLSERNTRLQTFGEESCLLQGNSISDIAFALQMLHRTLNA